MNAPEQVRTKAFQRERAIDLWPEIMPLLEKHWHEIAHYADIKLEPDVKAYNWADDFGALRCFTARVGETLVGYAIYFVRPNLHYTSSLQASQDVLFLLPEYRGKLIGAQFIAWCDAQLQAEGVQVVTQHVKAEHNFGPLLERMGYQLVDLIYSRRLD